MPYIGQRPATGEANSFKILDEISSYTLTFDGSGADVVSVANDTITEREHRFVTGQRVTYNDGGGTAITGLSDGVYYIIVEDRHTFKLASSANNAAAGTAINLTGLGVGASHTLNVAFDGVNTKFKATHTNGTRAGISQSGQLMLSINGVIQEPHDNTDSPSTGYAADHTSTIIFSAAPASTDQFFGRLIATNAPTFDISDNVVDNFTGDGSTSTFTLSKTPPNNESVLVTIDGVVQYPDDTSAVRAYTVAENILSFVSAPGLAVEIQVRHIGFAGPSSAGITGFYGRTGNAVLKSTDNIVLNNATASGTVQAANVTVTGDLTVNGTTTTLDTDLIGVDKLEVAANNTTVAAAITQTGTGDILSLYDGATEVFTVTDGGNLGIGINNPQRKLVVSDAGTEGLEFFPGDAVNGSTINAYNRTTASFTPFSVNAQDYRFSPNGGTEAVRIDSSGRLGLGAFNNSSYDSIGQNFLIANESSHAGMTIRSGGSGAFGAIHFADGVSDNNEKRAGRILYGHNDNFMSFHTVNAERLRIDSGGRITANGVDVNNAWGGGDDLVLGGTGSGTRTGITLVSGSDTDGGIYWSHGTGNNAYAGQIAYNHASDMMSFYTNSSAQLRITSAGDMGLGTNSPTSFGPTFQVSGTDPALLLQDTATAVDYFGMNIASGAVNTWYDDASAFVIHTATALSGAGLVERLRITSSGEIVSTNGTLRRNVSDSSFTVSGDTASNTGANINLYGASHSSLANVFRIRTGSTERLRITSAGLVGVNCTPLSQFQVKTATNANIALSADSSEASIEAYNDAGSANVPLRIRGSEIKFKIDGTQRARLSYSSSSAVLSLGDESNSAGHLRFEAKASENQIHGRSNHPITFLINTAEKLRIDTNGRLTLSNSEGIQLSAKTSGIFAVDGTLSYYATNNGVYLNGAGTNGWLRLNAAGTENDHNAINIFGGSAGAYIQMRTGNSESLRIDSSGRIGIGAFNNSSYDSNAQNVLIASDGNTGITIRSAGSTPFAMIHFADGTTGQAQQRAGRIMYQHDGDNLTFHTANEEKLRITSTGLLDVSGGIHVTENVTPTSGRGVEIFEAATGVGQISSYNRTGGSWDELRLKGSEVAIYTGTSNSLGLYLQSTASTLYGTSDGVFNLDTTDGRGAFIRFKQSASTKCWVGSAEGMGGGFSSPDQDDLGLRAVGGIRFSSNGGERIRIEENGSIRLTPEGSTSNPNARIDTSGDYLRLVTMKDGSGGCGFKIETQDAGVVGERFTVESNGKIRHSGGHANNSGNLSGSAYYRIVASKSIAASSNVTFVISGLASGWMTIRSGGYSNAGQSQYALMYQLGGYMTAANKYDVVTVQQWGSGVTISVQKNASDYRVTLTNNSGSYALSTNWCIEGSNSTIKIST